MLPLVRAINDHDREIERGKREFRHNRTWGEYMSILSQLPGIRGAWGLGSVDQTGAVYDLTHQGRTLTYNGNPTFNQHRQIIPYLDLDGTVDHLSRATEAGLEIVGTETIYASATRGLTMGGWFWSDSIATQYGLIGKFLATGNNRSYWLQFFSSQGSFSVSVDGTAVTSVAVGSGLVSATPYFVCGRFTPSTELKVWVNEQTNINTTSIPASLAVKTADFTMGGFSGGTFLLDGRIFCGFLSANALSDDVVNYLYHYGNVLIPTP